MQAKIGAASSHDRILQAAKQLFASRGYENTSTIMIARAAGTSESQLVKHFGSKDGLLEAIFDAGWESMGDLFEAVERCTDPADKLRALMEQTLLGLERDPELKDLMLLEARRVRKQGHSVLVTRAFLNFTRRLGELLNQMRERRELRPELRPEAVSSAIIGMCEGMLRDQLITRRMGMEPAFNADDIRQVVDAVLPAFLASVHAKHGVPGQD